MTGQHLTI